MNFDVLIHGDCLEELKKIPDNTVDMTFADPPFNLKKNYNSYSDKLELNEYLEWCKAWMLEMVRVTKPTGSIFVHNIPKWLTYYSAFLNEIAEFKHWIAWDAMGAPLGRTLLPNHYGILYYVKDAKQAKFYDLRYPHPRARKENTLLKDYGGKKHMLHPFGPLVSDVWSDIHRIRHNKRRDEHPCQLPLALLERLILMTTDEGDIVLDPFAGTGTSLITAKKLGRRYYGIELDENYVNITRKHLEATTPNSKLHDVWVSIYLNKIFTMRDKDWETLKPHFIIPEPIKNIDHTPIQYKYGKISTETHDKKEAVNKSTKNTESEEVALPVPQQLSFLERFASKSVTNAEAGD
jgi:site-specific DNA-methyltransferase (adenine-specific)